MSNETMAKKTTYTVLTPLPPGISRKTVIDTLHNHTEIIDLNPLLLERHQTRPPPKCMAEEFNCLWYSMTDRIQYLPGGLVSGKVTYKGCFHNLPMVLPLFLRDEFALTPIDISRAFRHTFTRRWASTSKANGPSEEPSLTNRERTKKLASVLPNTDYG